MSKPTGTKCGNTAKPALLALLVIFFMINTSALFSEDDIDLPDIVIVGEADKLPDTISLDRLLRRHWTIQDITPFEYQPFITFDPLPDYETEVLLEKDGVVTLTAGNKYYLHFRGKYISPANPLHNYSASLKTESTIDERRFFSGRFAWSPSFSLINNLFSTQTGEDNQNNGDTDTLPPPQLHTNAAVQYNTFKDSRRLGNEIEHLGTGVSLTYRHYLRPESPVSFRDSRLKLYYNSFFQDMLVEDNFTDFDAAAASTLSLAEYNINIPLELSLIRQRPAVSLGVLKQQLFFLEDAGIVILADEDAFVPSVAFQGSFPLNDYLSFRFENKPFIDKQRRIEFIKDNPDQLIDFDHPRTKTYINTKLSLHNYRTVPVSLSYNLRLHRDYYYYDQIDSANMGGTGSFFALENTDLLENIVELSAAYHLNSFFAGLNLRFRHADEFIPFRAEQQYAVFAGWDDDKVTVRGGVEYLANRQNLREQDMDDVLLLNLHGRYRLPYDLSLNISLENILNDKYRKYELDETQGFYTGQIPEEGFRWKAGLSWSF